MKTATKHKAATTPKERDQFEHAKQNAAGWLASIEEMLAALNATDRTDKEGSREWNRKRDEAQQNIHESALSVQVRGGWHNPGAESDGEYEYEILLSTGGPALRIFGQLGEHNEPESAELQMQDWFLPWTRFPASEATLLEFARQFYFGD